MKKHHKYRISREEIYTLRKKASYEYYDFHILHKNKSKALTPLAKKVRNIRLHRISSIKECTNEHIVKANRIHAFRNKVKEFHNKPSVYDADRLIEDYQDIISVMKQSSVKVCLKKAFCSQLCSCPDL